MVGKRTDKTKLWKLGNLLISECDHYKYLGVHISRNLSDHTHVNEVVKKGNRLIAYIKSIVDSHDNFNRIYYGNILWKSLAVPSNLVMYIIHAFDTRIACQRRRRSWQRLIIIPT